MRATDGKEINPAINPEAAEAMAKYGITRVPVDYFHYKEFRYTNLDDAIAQAKRQKERQGPDALGNLGAIRNASQALAGL